MSIPPDPSNPDLLEGIRTYLVDNGIVRIPSDGTHPDLPPMWIEPQYGTPAPGQSEGLNEVEVGPTLVTSIQRVTGIPPARYENFLRTPIVRFTVRTTDAYLAYAWEQQVRAILNDKRGWMMANVPVNESLLTRDLQPLGSGPLGYDYNCEYMFSLWAPEP